METQAYWRRYNMTFRDKDYSPQKGRSLWETCPQLALLDPGVGYTYFEDFFEFLTVGWIVTKIGGGTAESSNGLGGQLLITTGATEDNGIQIQKEAFSPKVGEVFLPAAGKPIWFEAKVQVVTAAKHIQSDLLVGLCIKDTTVIPGMTDGIYFLKNDGDALLNCVTESTSTPTTTVGTSSLAATTWVKLGFFCDGISTCYFYVDGVLVGTHTTNIPTVDLRVTFACLAGEAGATVWAIDYFKVVQIR